MEEKSFPCTSEGMVGAQAFLETVCAEPKPSILLDEVVSNIVRCSGADAFNVGLDRNAEGLVMVFSDAGKAFDPTREITDPDVTASLEERGIGGLGMFMVKKMSKSVVYRREGDRNVLTVTL